MTEHADFTPRPEDEEPIAELSTLLEEAPETLGQKVRWSIQRRVLAADVVELSLNHIFQVFLEFLKVTFEGLRGSGPKEGEDE